MVRRLVGAIVEAVAAEGLDPRRRRLVPLGPLGPRDLPVGHLAHQRMCEGELRLAGDHAPALATDELLAHELLELQPKARISGDVRYETLEMHQGATIDGELRSLKSEGRPSVLKLAHANGG